ncbi:uncharacterized protein LOC142101434 [Mixophyes fleayi]|uniref:uncharacterized protein LOC142101434 n=1 Tax=Mixophyes fleayi TaxID=3061075 RepID=UPI003F4D855D
MESHSLLDPQGIGKNAQFWVCIRRTLLILFWTSYALIAVEVVVLVVRAYEPPPRATWYQRSVLCYNTGLRHGNQTEVRRRIQEVSMLGCGGLILPLEDVKNLNVRSLVSEGQWSSLHIMLELHILNEYNSSQIRELKDAAKSWIKDGVSGFRLSGGQREAVIMVSDLLHEELENATDEERIILLPHWLCDDTAINKTFLLHTCPLRHWNLRDVPERSEVMQIAWEVSPWDDSLGIRQFMAVTQPGTVILSLSQSQPPPPWLHPLLLLRFQNPALYAGQLQDLSDNSSYSVLCHWRCSSLLVIISHCNQQQTISLHIPHYAPKAQLLLSTGGQRGKGQAIQDAVLLPPGTAQLLRLTPEEL